MNVDPGSLTDRWQQMWPQCPPIGHLFRHRMPERWVRFHSLPRGKRHPGNAAEYREILDRANAVLAAVLSEAAVDEIYVVTVEYGSDDLASGTEPIHVGLHPGAVAWMRAVDPEHPDETYRLHVSRQPYTPGDLDDLLRYVAEDRAPGVIITDTALRWLLHPYDGGVDVIAPSVEERDRLEERFSGWLSERPDGL